MTGNRHASRRGHASKSIRCHERLIASLTKGVVARRTTDFPGFLHAIAPRHGTTAAINRESLSPVRCVDRPRSRTASQQQRDYPCLTHHVSHTRPFFFRPAANSTKNVGEDSQAAVSHREHGADRAVCRCARPHTPGSPIDRADLPLRWAAFSARASHLGRFFLEQA